MFAEPVSASVESEIYRTSALLALSNQAYESALQQLEWAIAEDENDMAAHFYRAVALSRLGRFGEAAEGFEAVRGGGGTFPGLDFELGYASYRTRDLVKARGSLEQALANRPQHAPSNYYLGLVYYKQEEFNRALEPLETAARLEPSFAASSAYLRADALVRLGREREARGVIREALNQYPDSPYAEPMSDLLAASILRRQRQQRFSLEISLGATNDSNVGLFPDELTTTVPVESEEDQRLEFTADARWRPLSQGPSAVILGYRFFYSAHDDLGEFDVQNHVGSLDLQHRKGNVSAGLSYQFRQALLDGDDYSTINTLVPNVIVQHGRDRASLLKFQWSNNDYDAETQTGRTGDTSALQYRHYWLSSHRRNVYLGARTVYDDTRDRDFRYSGYAVELGIQRSWLPDWIFRADLSYERRFYRDSASDREDEHQEAALRFIRELNDQFEFEVALTGIVNPSNDEAFDYTRGIASFIGRWRL